MSDHAAEQERIFKMICQIIAEETDTNPDDITAETSFTKDLDMDINSIEQVLVACEMEFDASFEPQDAEDIQTVGELLQALSDW